MHAMGVLLGEPPEVLERELMSASEALPSPPELPPGLPSELLWRRPDIRTAERRVAAASAQIGVKTASLYPKLDLMALGSFAGMSLSDLLSRQNLIAAALGMASEPVFNGGRNRASVGEAREQYTQALLAYQATVIGALRDVEDALARQHGAADHPVDRAAAGHLGGAARKIARPVAQRRIADCALGLQLPQVRDVADADSQFGQMQHRGATRHGAVILTNGGEAARRGRRKTARNMIDLPVRAPHSRAQGRTAPNRGDLN